MPTRNIPLITGEIYHVLNRGNAAASIFANDRDYRRFIETFKYYQYTEPPLRFSHFLQLIPEIREEMFKNLQTNPKRVGIIAFCLMPNHFHFLLQQKEDGGIYDFMRQFTSSYSHYFNLKYKRRGTLFEGRFRAIRVEDEPQLLHLSRYIHLNPHSSNLTKTRNQLLTYRYSSLPEYAGKTDAKICQKDVVLTNFRRKGDYIQFVLNRADYQKSLEALKHFVLE